MRSAPRKDLSVYDFDEHDRSVEAASSKYVKKMPISKPKEEGRLTKFHFLQAFTLGHKQVEVTGIPCIDLSENSNSRGSFAIASPDRNSSEEKSELDEIMASAASYDERNNLYLGEFDHATPVRVDPLVTAASGLLVPRVGNEHFSKLQRDGSPADVISDDEESSSSVNPSPSTSASDLQEDEDYQEHPDSDNCCTTYREKDNDDMKVTVSPDYVIYRDTLYEEALLMFSPDAFTVECSNACRKSEKFYLECAVADIIHIECRWSGSVDGALIKFRLGAATVYRNENAHNTCDVGQLIFAVTEMHWQGKEQKIKSLAPKYEDVWNVLQYDDVILEDGTKRHDRFFPSHYFLEIPDSFEEVIYPKGDPDAVSISRRDIEQLQPDTFLNDTIIDFYIKYLKGRIQPNEKHRFHFFNSFFFRKLADLDKDRESASKGRAAFLRVRKWTRKVDIFGKDFIFIPVNFNLHWSLLVICHPGEAITSEGKKGNVVDPPKVPCILHMDSIKGSHSGLKNLLQSYLWEEWKERHPETPEENSSKFSHLRFIPLELPQQENSFDCGLFLLHYVELFLEEAPLNFSPFKITKFSKFLTVDWFSPSEASFKRSYIRKLVYDLLIDPCQKVNSSTCNETRMRHVSTSFLGASLCDKQEGLLLQQSLGSKATSLSSPKHEVNVFQGNARSQTLERPKCPAEEGPADGTEEFVSSSLDKNNGESFGGRKTTQTCSASYPNDGVCKMPGTCMQEKEIGADLLPGTLNNDHLISNQTSEIGSPGSVSMEDYGYVPDSPTSSSGKNQESGSEEIGTSKIKDTSNCENSEKVRDTTESTSDNDEECQDITTCEAEVAHSEDSQEIASSEAEEGDVVKRFQRFEDVNEAKRDGDGECQEISTIEVKVGAAKDPKEIVIGKGEKVRSIRNSKGIEDTSETEGCKGEEHKIIDTRECEVGNDEGCQKAEVSEAEGCQVVTGSVAEAVENDGDCRVIGPCAAEAVDTEDCKIVDTAEESLPLRSFDAILIADDSPLEKVRMRPKREKPATVEVAQYQKRRKGLHPGARMHIRSRSRDLPS
ncbi:putative ubiquitin-like-specific protease 2B [Iris pallida]|uniref:Ubiquitin-like-specific protease 2B n=1 Tax=Iris pallida TaxID=29817 RepID=A0AAX6F077_IRIPA|nr:putative ubiquitin-like-specific protease 2B [Iris pallida]